MLSCFCLGQAAHELTSLMRDTRWSMKSVAAHDHCMCRVPDRRNLLTGQRLQGFICGTALLQAGGSNLQMRADVPNARAGK